VKNIILLLMCIAVTWQLTGCGKSDKVSMYMPPGSPTESVDAALAYNEANKLRESEKAKAIELYTKAIEADPNFESAYFNRALTLAEIGEIEKAEADLESLKGLKSDKAETLEPLIGVARDWRGE